jgi:hypothetical protein
MKSLFNEREAGSTCYKAIQKESHLFRLVPSYNR